MIPRAAVLLLLLTVSAAPRRAAAQSKTGAIPIRLKWVYQGIPPGMRIYELAPGDWKTGVTKVAGRREDVPMGREISDSIVWTRPGGPHRKVVAVYENRGREPLYFFASPHLAEPAEYTLGFKFKCLCVNSVYQVFPGQYWYRILEVWLVPEYGGKHINVSHHLVAVESANP